MKLAIHLRNEADIVIDDFEKIEYQYQQSHIIKRDNFSDLILTPTTTYNFQGNRLISVLGSDILYLELLS
ncbi:MAG: hypothetical protein LBM95_05520 [Lactobacillales bacterium]|jgi:hypothetical protein|nr:hypothetical protein [Lactobacillales bacterium]